MVYGTQITIVDGVYKPTNITGGPHIVDPLECGDFGYLKMGSTELTEWTSKSQKVELWVPPRWRSGYGSIPINTIFRGMNINFHMGMNIHLPAILMFTRGTRFWHTAIWRGTLPRNSGVFFFGNMFWTKTTWSLRISSSISPIFFDGWRIEKVIL